MLIKVSKLLHCPMRFVISVPQQRSHLLHKHRPLESGPAEDVLNIVLDSARVEAATTKAPPDSAGLHNRSGLKMFSVNLHGEESANSIAHHQTIMPHHHLLQKLRHSWNLGRLQRVRVDHRL